MGSLFFLVTMKTFRILFALLIVLVAFLWYTFFSSPNKLLEKLDQNQLVDGGSEKKPKKEVKEEAFKKDGLKTNTAIAHVPLDQIINGGPGKDGIPSLTNPNFYTIEQASQKDYLNDWTLGLVLEWKSEARFYPYSIMNRHEVVNDTIDDQYVAVTFCPLCGSAIVFNRLIGDVIYVFWVSGKLWQSNLVMYDWNTETLWSQSATKAIIGDLAGTELQIVDSDVVTWPDFQELYPDGKVLSDQTWYNRRYMVDSPYGDYETNDDIYFPVDNFDDRLPPKTLLYVADDTTDSVAFIRSKILDGEVGKVIVGENEYEAYLDNGRPVIIKNGGTPIPSYVEMRFSRANKYPNTQNIWWIK